MYVIFHSPAGSGRENSRPEPAGTTKFFKKSQNLGARFSMIFYNKKTIYKNL
jgi:hypothetical protein